MNQVRVAVGLLLALGVLAALDATSIAEEGEHFPPIECPLRKAGINPHKLRPFKEVEKYIAFLERADRADWQKPDEVVKALELEGNEVLVDLGAGSGYFSFRFAKALPKGRVFALDTQAEMVRHVHHKAIREKITNVQAQIAKPDNPVLPPKTGIVFVCDVLHHVQDLFERAAGQSQLLEVHVFLGGCFKEVDKVVTHFHGKLMLEIGIDNRIESKHVVQMLAYVP